MALSHRTCTERTNTTEVALTHRTCTERINATAVAASNGCDDLTGTERKPNGLLPPQWLRNDRTDPGPPKKGFCTTTEVAASWPERPQGPPGTGVSSAPYVAATASLEGLNDLKRLDPNAPNVYRT